LKDDEEIMVYAVKMVGRQAVKFASARLRSSKKFAMRCILEVPKDSPSDILPAAVLRNIDKSLLADRDIIRAAVRKEFYYMCSNMDYCEDLEIMQLVQGQEPGYALRPDGVT